jgi:hypothetical protein
MRGNDVRQLQTFLVNQNFPGSGSWMITGRFLSATEAAVRNFQQSQGINPTGVVDYQTRTAISSMSCGGQGYSGYLGNNYANYNTYTTNSSYPIATNSYPYNYTNYNSNTYPYTTPTTNSYTCGSTYFNSYNSTYAPPCACPPSTATNNTSYNGVIYNYTSPTNCGTNQYNNNYNYGTSQGSILSVNGPSALGADTTGTWTVVVNNPAGGALVVSPVWGDGNTYPYNGSVTPQSVYASGITTLTFAHIYHTAGNYRVSFQINGANQTGSSASVVVSPVGYYNGVPTISSLSPMISRVGNQVTIYGSGFANTSTIMFGSGAIMNAYSSNGSTITFTVPSYVAAYCAGNYACPSYAQQITPGYYNVSVMTQYGTSNSLSLQIQ